MIKKSLIIWSETNTRVFPLRPTTWWNVGPIQLVELDLMLADAFLTDIFRPC